MGTLVLFMGRLILFWTSGDISSGFQSQSLICAWQRHVCCIFPEIHIWCNTCCHLRRPAWQPSHSLPCTCEQALVGSKLGPIMLPLTMWDEASRYSTNWSMPAWLGIFNVLKFPDTYTTCQWSCSNVLFSIVCCSVILSIGTYDYYNDIFGSHHTGTPSRAPTSGIGWPILETCSNFFSFQPGLFWGIFWVYPQFTLGSDRMQTMVK